MEKMALLQIPEAD